MNKTSFIFFHNPEEENGYLSNWYMSDFIFDNLYFSSMEQYMMYMKAKLFLDNDTAKEIMATSDVASIKSLGRLVKNYNDIIWNGYRQIIVYEGLINKFTQNQLLKDQLLNTNDSIIAECAVNDKIWGIGLSLKDEKRYDLLSWKGENILGFTLMKVRDYLNH